MIDAVIFPYHPDIEYLIELTSTDENFSITGVCSFNEDKAVVDEVNRRIGCELDYDSMMVACNTLIILENYRHCIVNKYFDVISKARDLNKKIIIMPQILEELELHDANLMPLKNYPDFNIPQIEKMNHMQMKKLEIETPVVVVFGMGKNCNKLENQLRLYQAMNEAGYKVAWVSSNALGVLWGSYVIPDFLFDQRISFEEKILKFNNFIYKIEMGAKPDVFIIGVPEGVSVFSCGEYNHFAEYSLVIGSAVPVDSAILCSYFISQPKYKGLQDLTQFCMAKFGFPVDAISIGRTLFETKEGSRNISYSFLSEEYVRKNYQAENSFPVSEINIWDKQKMQNAFCKIIEKLQYNADTI